MLPQTLLVAASAFDQRFSAQRVAAAVARGLADGGWQSDVCPLEGPAAVAAGAEAVAAGAEAVAAGAAPAAAERRAMLDALDFDRRMRAARALIVCERCLQEDTLAGSVAFEIATRARQAGVPTYAVTAENRLDSFDARILDLQAIVEAASARALRAAAHKLAALI